MRRWSDGMEDPALYMVYIYMVYQWEKLLMVNDEIYDG
jgi:hypothetical protein